MRVLTAALMVLVPQASPTEQFDLICNGEYRERINAPWKPFTTQFRIDLNARTWCSGSCGSVQAIHSVDTAKIVLSRSDPADGVSPYSFREFERSTGSYAFYMNGGGSYFEEKGICSRSPFSGMPSAKF